MWGSLREFCTGLPLSLQTLHIIIAVVIESSSALGGPLLPWGLSICLPCLLASSTSGHSYLDLFMSDLKSLILESV